MIRKKRRAETAGERELFHAERLKRAVAPRTSRPIPGARENSRPQPAPRFPSLKIIHRNVRRIDYFR
ncbi:hypothetical protein B5X24_HaOG214793 [Helicoverpa armigera]|nr:hypothetical protein B5X24_HaOG214793 [Helicoverpa armigera]